MPYKLKKDRELRNKSYKILKKKCCICKEKYLASKYKPNSKTCSIICRNTYVSRISSKKRGNKQRGRGKGLGYTKLNGKHEHRVVMEKKLGRKLKSNELVHHKDENKKNNNQNNLQLTNRSNHAKIHFTKHRN